jgi:hypothetical protein
VDGLAPETREFVARLNEEAKRRGTGVHYTALANRVEVAGNIEAAARSKSTLGGWFLRRAIDAGCLEGEAGVLRRGNSEWRGRLRARAKTKAGKRDRAALEATSRVSRRVMRASEAGEAWLGSASLIPSNYPRTWANGVYAPILYPHGSPYGPPKIR